MVNVESPVPKGKTGETGGLPDMLVGLGPGGPGGSTFRNPKPAEVTERDMPMGPMREG